jgi:hypothetical protein
MLHLCCMSCSACWPACCCCCCCFLDGCTHIQSDYCSSTRATAILKTIRALLTLHLLLHLHAQAQLTCAAVMLLCVPCAAAGIHHTKQQSPHLYEAFEDLAREVTWLLKRDADLHLLTCRTTAASSAGLHLLWLSRTGSDLAQMEVRISSQNKLYRRGPC